jgi:hypothetical protein
MATENGHRSLEVLKKDSHIVHSSNLELDVTCCYNISTPVFACMNKTHGRGWSRKANQEKECFRSVERIQYHQDEAMHA